MKHALLGPKSGIIFVSDTPYNHIPEGASTAPLSDEQAATVLAGRNARPPVQYFIIDGELLTLQEKLARNVPTPVRRQTKLNIMRKLVELGKWEQFKLLLGALPPLAQDAWDLAQEISSSDPMFVQNREAVMAGLGLTSEQLDSLFLP